jgi:hypothetical protein
VVDEKEALKKDEPEEETKRKDNSKLVNFVISFYDNLPSLTLDKYIILCFKKLTTI